MASFSVKSYTELSTCDPRLVALFLEVVKYWDCTVIDGRRTEEEQEKNLARGVSWTKDSKHLHTPSLAADVAPYPIDWDNTKRFYAFAGFVIGVATMMGIKVRWGGDWDSDRDLDDQRRFDLVHFEIAE